MGTIPQKPFIATRTKPVFKKVTTCLLATYALTPGYYFYRPYTTQVAMCGLVVEPFRGRMVSPPPPVPSKLFFNK